MSIRLARSEELSPNEVAATRDLIAAAWLDEPDGGILVRPTPTTPELNLSAPISCDRRPGDVW